MLKVRVIREIREIRVRLKKLHAILFSTTDFLD